MTLSISQNEKRKEYARFLLAFIFLAFLMKIAGEFIHEMGHALFALIFGGRVLSIKISVEWPFTLSQTIWEIPNPTNTRLALVAVAGVLFDTLTTITGQAILLVKKNLRPIVVLSIFWLSFWTYLNSVVYLVVGAFNPFGDILDLTKIISIPDLWIGIIGFILLFGYSYSLSIILREIFSMVLSLERTSNMVYLFWIGIHFFFVSITVVKYGLPTPPTIAATILVMIFAWSYISGKWLMGLVSKISHEHKLGIIKTPSELSGKGVKSLITNGNNSKNKYAMGLTILILFAIASAIVTGFAINQYTSTYSLIMKTDISIDTSSFKIDNDEAKLNLTVLVLNPTRKTISVNRIEFDVKLNGKYMMEQNVLREIPQVKPDAQVEFYYSLNVPQDRWFTLDEAISQNNWDWSVSGTGYVDTMFGETLLRFKTKSTLPPVIIE
jgi:hypothetical protein